MGVAGPDDDLYPSERIAMLYSPHAIGMSARRMTMHGVNWGRQPGESEDGSISDGAAMAVISEDDEVEAERKAWESVFINHGKGSPVK